MKIIVKIKKKATSKAIDWKKLPRGTVVKLANGLQAMVYCENTPVCSQPALLLFGFGVDFEQANGFLDIPVIQVIGEVTEIIAEEI